MGTVYARGNRLWIGVKSPAGKWAYSRTEFVVGQEAKARKLLETIERRIQAGQAFGEAEHGPVTVQRYFERWVADRKRRGIGSAKDDETRLARHAMPTLGSVVLKDVRPLHVRNLIRDLKARCGPGKDQLAPRTVRHVYGTLHRLFEDAVAEELIEVNPCALKRGELPKKADKDPTWRAQAVYTREEVEQLITDERIPEERRIVYAGIFLTGCRIGEWAARRWKDLEPSLSPLGRLLMATSYNTKRRREKGVKSDQPRPVPVHPTLARILAAWKSDGWARTFGRAPTPEDLISATPDGKNLSDKQVRLALYKDLELLGFRRRRTHDSRRTFISLAQADGARKDILRWVTHGPEGDIVDLYTTLPWATLCDEVAKLRILPSEPHEATHKAAEASRRAPEARATPEAPTRAPEPAQAASQAAGTAQVIPLHQPDTEEITPETGGALLQRLLQSPSGQEKAPKSQGLGGSYDSGGGGNRIRIKGMENLKQDKHLPAIPLD